MVRTVALAGALICALTVSREARAEGSLGFETCNTKPTKSNTAQAKKDYEAGKKLYDSGVKGAAEKFHAAYMSDCTKHELLVLLSFAYQSDGLLKEAILADELYVQKRGSSLSAEDRQTIEERLRSLRSTLDEQEKQKEREQAELAKKNNPPDPVRPPPAQEPKKHSALPWIPIGVGAAALVAGAVMIPVGSGMFPEQCKQRGGYLGIGGSEECDRLADGGLNDRNLADANKAKGVWNAGVTSLIGGGVLVASGVVWLIIDRTTGGSSEKTQALRVVPLLGPTHAGLAGTF